LVRGRIEELAIASRCDQATETSTALELWLNSLVHRLVTEFFGLDETIGPTLRIQR
jgi:hypothetical protein